MSLRIGDVFDSQIFSNEGIKSAFEKAVTLSVLESLAGARHNKCTEYI